jgi:hypothetical protein
MKALKLGWWMASEHSSVPDRMAARRPITSIARCTVRLLSWTMSGGTLATRSATARTRSSSSSAGKAALAQPSRAASAPEIESPVSIISIAARMPMNQAWNCMSGVPNRTAG